MSGAAGSEDMGGGGTRSGEDDAGAESGTGAGGSEFMYPRDCPQPRPVAAPDADPPQVVVIQSVNFETSEIVIRNISSTEQVIDGGEMGWQWCILPYYNSVLRNEELTLEPGQTLAFRPVNQGSYWPIYPGEQGDPNELAIYVTTGSFMTPDLMRAFVSWGAGYRDGRESVAVQAGLWTATDRVEIQPGHAGLVITGRADERAGYTSVPARCLIAPPNPPGTLLPEP